MKYPFVSFIEINGYKTILLTYDSEDIAEVQYNLFKPYVRVEPYTKGNILEIKILFSAGGEMIIQLIKPISEYKNHKWLIDKELTHIATTFHAATTDKNPLLLALHQIQ